MTKRKSIILIAIACVLVGGVIVYAQLFRPLEQSPNENLLKNSGWQEDTSGWGFGNNCTVDNSKKYKECNSIKSEMKYDTSISKYTSKIQAAQPSIKTKGYATKNLTFSCFAEYQNPISAVSCKIDYILWFEDGTYEEHYNVETSKIQIDSITYKFNYTITISVEKKLKEISIENIGVKQESLLESDYGYIWLYQPKLEYGSTVTPYRPALTDNVTWDYDTPNSTFQSAKIGNIKNIISYSYHKSLTQVGDFSMTFSKNEKYANLVVEDTFIKKGKDWLIVNNVKLDNDIYTVTGFDGKGLLMQRITLYDIEQDTGAMGYDVCQGSTEAIIKHYIANNIVNPLDDNRKIVGVALGDNQDRGILADSFMSRLDPLHEIVEKMCKYANIGYDVKVDLMNNKQIFDIVDITDKSASQRDRPQIIFEKKKKNILSLSREFGNSNEKNCYYATKSGGNLEADAITILVTPTDTVEKGIKRREMHLNVSCDSVADIATYAKQQMTPYQKTNSFIVATSDVKNYNKLFFIGDKVTIRNIDLNITEDLVICGAKVDEANGSITVALEFGEAKPKLIRDFNNKINNKGV